MYHKTMWMDFTGLFFCIGLWRKERKTRASLNHTDGFSMAVSYTATYYKECVLVMGFLTR